VIKIFYIPVTQSKIIEDNQSSYRVLALLKAHAETSFYRLNAGSADCYAFNLDTYNGKKDFSGGWDWLDNLVDTSANYIYDLKTKKFAVVMV